MQLQKVIINNFKNIKHLELDINQQNFELKAPNGWGKSSIADAIFWVMTGKLLSGSSDMPSIKPKEDTSRTVDVELIFEDGTSVKKTYREVWTKTRGTTEVKMTGHETSCYINGLEVPVSQFDVELRQRFGLTYKGAWSGNIFQLLIDPLYFGMKEEWQERRKLVIDLVGDVTDEDVFAQKPSLLPLKLYIDRANGKLEDVKKLLLRHHRELSTQEATLQAQIDVLSTELTVSEQAYQKAIAELEKLDALIDDLKTKKYQSEEGALAEKNRLLANLKEKAAASYETDLLNYNNNISQQQQELDKIRTYKATISSEFTQLVNRINELERQKSQLVEQHDSTKRRIAELEVRRQRLIDDWKRVKNEEPPTHDHLYCPQCGYDLNEEHIKAQVDKFNLDKANRLKQITAEGNTVKAEIEELTAQLDPLKKQIDDLHLEIEELDKQKSDYNAKIIELNNKELQLSKSIPPFEPSKETLELKAKYEELKNQPLNVDHDYEVQIETLKESRKPYEEIITRYKVEQLNLKKAQELKQQRETVLAQLAEIEQLQIMLTDFIRTKLEILDSRIEAVFGDIKFRLVEANIKEGSWNEVCDVMDGEVPYHQTNSSQQIKLGIQVVEAIKRTLGIDGLFYIIDNAEQITDRDFSKLTDAQTIAFVAYDDNKTTLDIDLREDKPYRPEQIDYNLFNMGR